MNYIVKFFKQKQPIKANVEGVKFNGIVPMFWIKTKNNTFWVNPNAIETLALRKR